MAPLFEFDPTSEDAANSPLEIWSTTDYAVTAFSAPAPPFEAQWAGTVDTEGSLIASRKHQNRTISLTVDVASAAGLRNLQAKMGKIAREGGTAKMTFPNSEVVIFDLHAADTFEPQLDITYFVNTGTFCTVNLTLLGKPYGRGPEQDLGDNVETALPWLVFTDTGIKGDMPALGRLVVDNDEVASGAVWLGWGIQSRRYDSAATAALFYQAESCALFGGTTAVAGPAGASGSGSNVARNTTLGTSATNLLYIGTSSTAQTHIGTFRIFVRAYAPAANTGIVSLGVQWTPYVSGPTITNDPVPLELSGSVGIEDSWTMLDLGTVSIPVAATGSQGWLGWIYSQSTVSGDDINIDWVALVPVDESAGEAYQTIGNGSLVAQTASAVVRHDGVYAQSGTSAYWVKPVVVEGDYLRIPPGGLEGRTVRVICRLCEHIPLNVQRGIPLAVVGADTVRDLSAHLYATPRYLVVPSP